jgi:hypothetical protein
MAAETVQRAQLPEFDPTETSQVFFDDVFSVLSGARPEAAGAVETPGVASAAAMSGRDSVRGSAFSWASLISPTTIEDEIKLLKIAVDANVRTPTEFAGRGHKQVRRHFTVLAMLFAVIQEYDGQVRWRGDAVVARDRFARAASNSKAGGNVNVFNEAKQRKLDLQDLVGGGSLGGTTSTETTDWEAVVDRGPLMQRLEEASQDRLPAWTASEAEFASHREGVIREAEMVAAIAEVLTRDGLEDAGDEDYVGFAEQMKQAAQGVSTGARGEEYAAARAAVGEVAKSCAACHESYR